VILSFHKKTSPFWEPHVSERKYPAITRRKFAIGALLTTAAATLAAGTSTPPTAPSLQSATSPPAPSEASQSESALRLQTILTLYGARFSEDQKAGLKKICNSTQSSLDRLRAYKVENSDDPALHLKPLMEHEKKSPASPAEKPPAKL
jgi:hypothetical protein